MDIEFQVNNGSKAHKPRFIFEDHNDFIKREPVINEELKISVIDLDAVKTEHDEPNQSEKFFQNIPIETKINFPIENQEKELITFVPDTAEITRHYTISTSENSDNRIVPEIIDNNLLNETKHVEIKTETLEPIAEVDVKEHITFEPFAELDIKENIVKSEENVVKQSLGIEDFTDNLKNGKSVLKYTVKNEVNSSKPIVIEDNNKISCMFCEIKVKDLIQLAIHTHNFHYQSQYSFEINKIEHVKQQDFMVCDHCEYQTKRKANLVQHIFARHMSKKGKKTRRRCLKYSCNFCDKKFTNKCKLYEHNKTHDEKGASCKCLLRSLKIYAKAPGTKPYACNLCKHIACTGGALKCHMAVVHNLNSVVYYCDHCKSSFTQKEYLITHLKLQSDNYTSDYKCLYTNNKKYRYGKGFAYDYEMYLLKGNAIDNYEMQSKSYECTTCPFKCTKRHHLKAHLIRHNAMLAKKPAPVEESYSCTFCKFKSTNEKVLNKHLRKNHKQLKPYFCKLCDCKYSVMNDLVRHIKATHFVRRK